MIELTGVIAAATVAVVVSVAAWGRATVIVAVILREKLSVADLKCWACKNRAHVIRVVATRTTVVAATASGTKVACKQM